jgi:hypothetical protein
VVEEKGRAAGEAGWEKDITPKNERLVEVREMIVAMVRVYDMVTC